MHYKNGRPANNGDRVIILAQNGFPAYAGILYNAQPGNDTCNGRVAVTTPNDPYPDLRNVLHADDVAAADVPSTYPPAPAAEPGTA